MNVNIQKSPQRISLNNAVFSFCDPYLLQAYNNAIKAFEQESNEHYETIKNNPDKVGWQAFSKSLALYSRTFQAGDEEMKALRKNLIQKIKCGELFAHGYLFPRKIDDALVQIPHDFLDHKIDWQKSEIEGQGLRFVGIVICSSNFEIPRPDIRA